MPDQAPAVTTPLSRPRRRRASLQVREESGIVKFTCRLPAELHHKLKVHALVTRGLMRDMFQFAIDDWVANVGWDDKMALAGKIDFPLPEFDDEGEHISFKVQLESGTHRKLKLLATGKRVPMRLIIIGIMWEWAEKYCQTI